MRRRDFLGTTGAAGLGTLFFAGRNPLLAGTGKKKGNPAAMPILVVVFQRGAMDGLAAVQPLEDPYLGSMRPNLILKAGGEEGLLDLGGGFGLHPALAPLHPAYRSGKMAVVHGVGLPDAVRSHFDAQALMESGKGGGNAGQDGWLNRVLGQLPHQEGPFRAVALEATMPLALYGANQALAVADISRFGKDLARASRYSALLGHNAQSLGEEVTAAQLEQLLKLTPKRIKTGNGPQYPNQRLGKALQQVAGLIKAGMAPQIAFVNAEGWDTHRGQGAARGAFFRAARPMAAALSAFWQDLAEYQHRLVVLTMTEFGRTVAQNGSGGTDHGRGSCFLVLGDKVAGGRVHGEVPSLKKTNLADGRDLPVSVDYRSVLAGLLKNHLQIPKPAAIFPGWRGKPLKLFSPG